MNKLLAVLLLAVFIAAPALAKNYKIERDNNTYNITYSSTAIDFETGEVVEIKGSTIQKTSAWVEAKIVELGDSKISAENAYNARIAAIDAEIETHQSMLDDMNGVPQEEVEVPDINWEDLEAINNDGVNWTNVDIIN